MPTLVIFIALAVILSILLAVIVLTPWLRSDKSAQNDQLIALNVEVFKERLEELKSDYGNGQMSETEFKTQKTELERQLLLASDDKNITIQDHGDANSNETSIALTKARQEYKFTRSAKARLTILICVPLLVVLAYFLSADRSPVVNLWEAQDKMGQVADDLLTGKIDTPPKWAAEDSIGLLGAIQTNVHHHAFDAMRWMRLSDIFLAFEANDQALEAQARAYRLQPDDEAIAVRYAQTQFFTSGGMLGADSRRALNNVLQKNPEHQGAQMLMAMGEARAGNFDQAQAWIDKLRLGIASRDGDHSEALQSLDTLSQNIAQQKQASLNEQSAESGSPIMNGESLNAQSIQVTVTLNPSLYPLIEPSDILYVTVKDISGGAPLAVKRLPANELKNAVDGFKIDLNDSDAMMPSHTITNAMSESKQLMVTARISKSGQALTESGDLAAEPIELKYAKNKEDSIEEPIQVTIEINKQVS